MERYSVAPVSVAEGYRSRNVSPINYPGMKISGPEIEKTQIRHTLLDGDQSIAYVSPELQYNGGRGWSVSMLASLKPKPDYVPAYFLPWDEQGAAVEINIPKKSATLPEDQHPKLFFTAALSGCSVYVKGTQDRPTIVHCGIGGVFTIPADFPQSSDFWDLVLDLSETYGYSNAYVGKQAAVHNRDYMRPKKGPAGPADAHATSFKAKLDNKYRDLRFEYVEPWGSVFGIRNGTLWTFYLQENATVVIGKPDGSKFTTSRPIVVRQIFPAAAGVVTVQNKWKSIRKALAANQG